MTNIDLAIYRVLGIWKHYKLSEVEDWHTAYEHAILADTGKMSCRDAVTMKINVVHKEGLQHLSDMVY